MFQSIYSAHLKDRLRGKKLRNQLESKYNPFLPKHREMVGITNLFILATAALSTILPRDSEGVARVHSDIETISAGLSDLSADTKTFDATKIVEDLQQLEDDVMAAARHVEDGGAVGDTEALALIFYIKNAMAPVVDETLLDLRKVRGKLNIAGKQDEVRRALEDLKTRVVVLGAALLRKTPENKRQDGLAVFDAIVADFQDAVKYFDS